MLDSSERDDFAASGAFNSRNFDCFDANVFYESISSFFF